MAFILTVCRPGWLKRMFTDIVTFTVKLVVKSQVSVSSSYDSALIFQMVKQNIRSEQSTQFYVLHSISRLSCHLTKGLGFLSLTDL